MQYLISLISEHTNTANTIGNQTEDKEFKVTKDSYYLNLVSNISSLLVRIRRR